MAITPTGQIKFSDIQTEFGGTNPIGLSEYYRGGVYVPPSPQNANIPTSAQIKMSNFYGTSKRVAVNLTISAPTSNYDVYTNKGVDYVSGLSDINVTINPGISVGSSSTGSYAFLIPSEFNPTDTVTVVNNGNIYGSGGSGGSGGAGTAGGTVSSGVPGYGGGNAIYVNRPTTFINNGVVAGGGGGGGGGYGGGASSGSYPGSYGGGGGGGGAGVSAGSGGGGGAGKYPGFSGGSGNSSSGGSGGSGGKNPVGGSYADYGGNGGGLGSSGSQGGKLGVDYTPVPGGSGGNYIVGNAFVTWPATGTRYGGVA